MKKKYESPVLHAEIFNVNQNVAVNCKPGVKEEEVSPITVKCEPGSNLLTIILGLLGMTHDHGLGLTEDSQVCISTAQTTIFAVSGCTTQVNEGSLRTSMGTSYVTASWSSETIRGNHATAIENGSASQPYYWNS